MILSIFAEYKTNMSRTIWVIVSH